MHESKPLPNHAPSLGLRFLFSLALVGLDELLEPVLVLRLHGVLGGGPSSAVRTMNALVQWNQNICSLVGICSISNGPT